MTALSLALSIHSSGSFISWNFSFPNEASRFLRGSALGEGMDWMMRRTVSVFPASDRYLFPSEAINFSCPIFSDISKNHS